jgi:hypothetical protein
MSEREGRKLEYARPAGREGAGLFRMGLLLGVAAVCPPVLCGLLFTLDELPRVGVMRLFEAAAMLLALVWGPVGLLAGGISTGIGVRGYRRHEQMRFVWVEVLGAVGIGFSLWGWAMMGRWLSGFR